MRVRACDPLNLVGIVLPGARVPAHHATELVFRDGGFLTETSEAPAPSLS